MKLAVLQRVELVLSEIQVIAANNKLCVEFDVEAYRAESGVNRRQNAAKKNGGGA